MTLQKGLVEIGDLITAGAILAIQDGNHGAKHPKASDYVEDGISFVMANDLNKGTLAVKSTSKIPESLAEKLRIGFSVSGDVLLTHKGTIGNTAIVPEVSPYIMLTPQVTYYRVDPVILNNHYLMYCFRERSFQKVMASLAQQSTRPYIGITAQRKLKIFFRNIDEQSKVVSRIKIYDDLIGNNYRRIQLLDDAVGLLYKEWFVSLRYPGHEHEVVTGGVPRGWSRRYIKDCCTKVSYGYTASASLEKVGPKFLRITDIVPQFIDWETVPYCEIGEKEKNTHKVVSGDVVVARTGATVGYAKQIRSIDQDVVYASYLVRFRPDPEIIDDLIFGIFMESREYKEFVRSNAGGAAQPNANAQILGSASLLVPSNKIQAQFRIYCEDSLKLKEILIKQIAQLQKSRDLLLPRLMNGDITV